MYTTILFHLTSRFSRDEGHWNSSGDTRNRRQEGTAGKGTIYGEGVESSLQVFAIYSIGEEEGCEGR